MAVILVGVILIAVAFAAFLIWRNAPRPVKSDFSQVARVVSRCGRHEFTKQQFLSYVGFNFSGDYFDTRGSQISSWALELAGVAHPDSFNGITWYLWRLKSGRLACIEGPAHYTMPGQNPLVVTILDSDAYIVESIKVPIGSRLYVTSIELIKDSDPEYLSLLIHTECSTRHRNIVKAYVELRDGESRLLKIVNREGEEFIAK